MLKIDVSPEQIIKEAVKYNVKLDRQVQGVTAPFKKEA
jgi:hypothetical protein